MGQAPTKQVQKTDVVNEIVAKAVMKNISKCNNVASIGQQIVMECDAPPEIATKYATSKACATCSEKCDSGDACDCPVCYACAQSDLNQEAVFNFSTSCVSETQNSGEFENSVSNDIMAQLDDKLDGLGQLFEKKGDKEQVNNLVNDISTEVQNMNMTEMINEFHNHSVIKMKGTTGLQRGISQRIALDVIATNINKNQNAATAINELKNVLDTKAKKEITSPFQFVTDLVTGVVGSYSMIVVAVVGLMGAVVIFAPGLLTSFLPFGGGGGGSSSSPPPPPPGPPPSMPMQMQMQPQPQMYGRPYY